MLLNLFILPSCGEKGPNTMTHCAFFALPSQFSGLISSLFLIISYICQFQQFHQQKHWNGHTLLPIQDLRASQTCTPEVLLMFLLSHQLIKTRHSSVFMQENLSALYIFSHAMVRLRRQSSTDISSFTSTDKTCHSSVFIYENLSAL